MVMKNFTCVTLHFAVLLSLENISTAQFSLKFPILMSLSSLCFLFDAAISNVFSTSLSWRNWSYFFPLLKKRGLGTLTTNHSSMQFGDPKIMDNLPHFSRASQEAQWVRMYKVRKVSKSIFVLLNSRNKRRHQIPSW